MIFVLTLSLSLSKHFYQSHVGIVFISKHAMITIRNTNPLEAGFRLFFFPLFGFPTSAHPSSSLVMLFVLLDVYRSGCEAGGCVVVAWELRVPVLGSEIPFTEQQHVYNRDYNSHHLLGSKVGVCTRCRQFYVQRNSIKIWIYCLWLMTPIF